MDYFEKIGNNPYEDLYWNIPEKKQGAVNVRSSLDEESGLIKTYVYYFLSGSK